MFCMKCGNELREGATFCDKCGNPVAEIESNINNPAPAQNSESAQPQQYPQPIQPQQYQQPIQAPIYQQQAKSKGKKTKIIIPILIAILLIIGGSIFLFIKIINPKIKENKSFVNAKVGDVVKLGAYEQDNDTSNGKEDIEWIVLDKDGDKALLISKYALECKPYNEEYTDVTWETCTLREWLNEDFIDDAFSEEEKSKIKTTNVSADENPEYDTNPGNDTEDKIFLLSIKEAEEYFSSNADRECQATDYAVDEGVWTSDEYSSTGEETCWWWLRSPGDFQDYATGVDHVGGVSGGGVDVDIDLTGVRPALWVEI